jgi:iron complex outermembrane receptor protein
VTYTSSDPAKHMGGAITQSFGSADALRTYVRLDTGEHNGFSAYLSGQYSRQNLFRIRRRATPPPASSSTAS